MRIIRRIFVSSSALFLSSPLSTFVLSNRPSQPFTPDQSIERIIIEFLDKLCPTKPADMEEGKEGEKKKKRGRREKRNGEEWKINVKEREGKKQKEEEKKRDGKKGELKVRRKYCWIRN